MLPCQPEFPSCPKIYFTSIQVPVGKGKNVCFKAQTVVVIQEVVVFNFSVKEDAGQTYIVIWNRRMRWIRISEEAFRIPADWSFPCVTGMLQIHRLRYRILSQQYRCKPSQTQGNFWNVNSFAFAFDWLYMSFCMVNNLAGYTAVHRCGAELHAHLSCPLSFRCGIFHLASSATGSPSNVWENQRQLILRNHSLQAQSVVSVSHWNNMFSLNISFSKLKKAEFPTGHFCVNFKLLYREGKKILCTSWSESMPIKIRDNWQILADLGTLQNG